MDCYVDWKKMRALTGQEFHMLKVGDSVYYVNGSDELNTITQDKHRCYHMNRVVYEAEVIQVTRHLIVLRCIPVTGSIHGWSVGSNIVPHIESFCKRDDCADADERLYRTIEWEFVE